MAEESTSTACPLGSFVYAIPDRVHPPNVISTPLYTSTSSIDYANRTAKILSRKTSMPFYVGCSINFSGITTDEEMEGLSKIITVVMAKWEEYQASQNLLES